MKRFGSIALLIIIGLLPLYSLLHTGLPITHDGQDHVARIANFSASLSEGNIVPRWASNLNWGYGHPILMFLYPMSSYIGSAVHSMGFSFVDSTKIVFALAYLASICSMYLWVQAVWGKKSAMVAALLYGFAPYRFVDLYVRGAIGEHVAFVFPPLIMYFLFKLSQEFKSKASENVSRRVIYISLGSISLSALILSHNAISLMFIPVIIAYCFYVWFFETKRSYHFLGSAIVLGIFGFALSAFFWIPAYFEGKYTLRDIVTKGTMIDRFVPWSWFLYSPWNYGGGNDITKMFGFGSIVGIIVSLFQIRGMKQKKDTVLIIGCLLGLLGSVWIMTDMSKAIWNGISLLQKFQFPWRFLTLTTFFSSVIGGFSLGMLVEGKQSWKRYVFILLMIGIPLSTLHMWKPKAFLEKPEEYFSGIYKSTTDTGESSPIWSVRFMEYEPNAPITIIEGTASISAVKRTTTERTYLIDAVTRTRIGENTLFFPGWNITVDGKTTEIQFQDPEYRGLMTFWVEGGHHEVQVVFTDTKVRAGANYISIGAAAMLIMWLIGGMIWNRKTH